MAEFEQTMKDWRRMCKNRPCDVCRLAVNGICDTDPESRTDEDIWKIEKIINEWAVDHPEPIYPTWVEYLVGIGVIPHEIRMETADALMDTHLLKPIPADIAEKLGLQPKEG